MRRLSAAVAAWRSPSLAERGPATLRPGTRPRPGRVVVPLRAEDTATITEVVAEALSTWVWEEGERVSARPTPGGLVVRIPYLLSYSGRDEAPRRVTSALAAAGYAAERVPADWQAYRVLGRDPEQITTMTRAEAEALRDAVITRLAELDMTEHATGGEW